MYYMVYVTERNEEGEREREIERFEIDILTCVRMCKLFCDANDC